MFGSDNNMQQPSDVNPQVVAPQPGMMQTASAPTPATGPMLSMADSSATVSSMPASAPTIDTPLTSVNPQITDSVTEGHPSDTTEHLAGLKQEALDHLSPLVQHLDQSPEEKFQTTMMMIQASDNHHLLSDALAAAKQIADDKVRAQALLDIINEINYFTQLTTK